MSVSLLALTSKVLYNNELVQLRAQVAQLEERLHQYEPRFTPHVFANAEEYEQWSESIEKQVWLLFQRYPADRSLIYYNSTGAVELISNSGYDTDDLNVGVAHIIESDDILRQSGVHTSHLLQWTTPFELWVAELRTQGHFFDTYADLLHVCKGPFSRMFQLYFTDLPFGTVGTWDK